jgi:hypothetical protein
MENQNSKPQRKKVPGIYVQLNDEEMKQVENLCISYGEKVQKLFRRLIFGVELPKVVLHPEGSRDLLTAINRIGNNINQIARRVNEGAARGWYHEFERAANELTDIRNLLRKHLGYC